MASSLLVCVILICLYAGVTSVTTQGHFPLKNCVEDATDWLWLLEYEIEQTWIQQYTLSHYVSWEFVYFDLSRNNAVVVDQFSAYNKTINVSDWSFHEYDSYIYIQRDTEQMMIPKTDLKSLLELKIQFVDRLFVEMSGVRQTAIHVGVVFLDGSSLTHEEIRNVPSIIQMRNNDVKIFVVIFGNKLVEEIVHLTDTLVLPDKDISNFDQYLLMAMCKKCGQDWFLFEHTTDLNILSCYNMVEISGLTTWTSAMSLCNRNFNSYLAVIETIEEMLFLKNHLHEILEDKNIFLKNDMHEILKDKNIYNAHVNIGLRRDLCNYAKRFQWETTPGRYRPLLVHHWLPGEPCTGCSNADCGVWTFTSNWTNDHDSNNVAKNNTSGVDALSEGWAGVNCHSEMISSTLCEVALPRKIDYSDFINSMPAPTESITSYLEKGQFLIYETNIVSKSANVGNPQFLQFLRDSNEDFPIFDCGEDVGDRRYISYSLVCDFVDHCRNRRDELLCSNPLEVVQDKKMYCTSGQRLGSLAYKCDSFKDCEDGSDEKNCIDNCNSLQCNDGSCLPLQWLNDGEFDCFIYTDSSNDLIVSDESSLPNMHLPNNKSCALVCDRHTCTNESQLRDGMRHHTGPEGPLHETIGKLQPTNTCKSAFGHYIWAPLCHYFTNRYGGIIGGRDMSHLRGCESFQCGQGYVKCYNSYCIPQHYLRDGKADCPTGEDEQLFYTGPCTGYFACWDSNICRHPDLVCDGRPDCPHGDDELDCREFCPKGFHCIGGTVTLSDYKRSDLFGIRNLYALYRRTRYLDLSGVELNHNKLFININIEKCINLKVIILSKCNIHQLYAPSQLYQHKKKTTFMIQKLDISHNKLEYFSKLGYSVYYKYINYLNISYNMQLKSVGNLRFSSLEILDLSYTGLSYLKNSVFAQLPRLKHLNLSHTLISDFTRKYFGTKFTLQALDLRGIRTEDLDDYVFHGLTISQALYTDHVQICCPQIQGLVITSHMCIAPVDVDAISSCYNLVGLSVQRVLLWIVAVLAVLGNITVIVYRAIWDRSVLKTGFGLFVTNLGISDFIMGVYLFIIAGADYFYRDNYVLYDKSWRNSDVCKIAGFMACLSCEASTFFVFLITLDRFLVMKFPFGQKKWSKFLKTITVMISWVASFLLSLVPIVFSFDMYSSNAMCLGLPLTNTQAKGRVYSVGVFIICNLIMFLFIAYGQYAIFRAMSENRISKTATSMSPSRRAKDITIAKQLSLVVMSNFLFWFPVGLMGLLSLSGHDISNEVYAWTTVLLLPINSAANPVLYTIPALMARWKNFKLGDQRMLSHSV